MIEGHTSDEDDLEADCEAESPTSWDEARQRCLWRLAEAHSSQGQRKCQRRLALTQAALTVSSTERVKEPSPKKCGSQRAKREKVP